MTHEKELTQHEKVLMKHDNFRNLIKTELSMKAY